MICARRTTAATACCRAGRYCSPGSRARTSPPPSRPAGTARPPPAPTSASSRRAAARGRRRAAGDVRARGCCASNGRPAGSSWCSGHSPGSGSFPGSEPADRDTPRGSSRMRESGPTVMACRAVDPAEPRLAGRRGPAGVVGGDRLRHVVARHDHPEPHPRRVPGAQRRARRPPLPPTPSPTPANSATATLSARDRRAPPASTAGCRPAPGSDFYKQAVDALQQSQGGTGYVIKAVRYFAGPLAERRDRRRLLPRRARPPAHGARAAGVRVPDPRRLPSPGPARPAGRRGTGRASKAAARRCRDPAARSRMPGKWAGPEYDPVAGTTPLLSPSLAGCLDGT